VYNKPGRTFKINELPLVVFFIPLKIGGNGVQKLFSNSSSLAFEEYIFSM
jgi:hypothetical protein